MGFRSARIGPKKLAFAAVSVVLLVIAIQMMQDGASVISPLLRTSFGISGPLSALGFGWLFAVLVLSGSPVAAASLTFLASGSINAFETFAMIIGSRLGSAFIVLFIGFIYVLRGKGRQLSLSVGLLTLMITITTYFPAFLLGTYILEGGWLSFLRMEPVGTLQSVIDFLYGPIRSQLEAFLPPWAFFPLGVGVIMASFRLFDLAFPDIEWERSRFRPAHGRVFSPYAMFGLGLLVTAISLSVSISLSILVPLSAKGYFRFENAIPYIMGANITTFVDTLFVSLIVNHPDAFLVVMVQMIVVSAVSLIIILTSLRPYSVGLLRVVASVRENDLYLGVFLALFFATPILMLLL